ncbi:MAG: Nif3-like dinuclear metal center hexameric protein [Syntrophobacteraceae bacterium]
MAQVKDILMCLDTIAPFRYAADWDQCGLQVGDPEAAVERILVALDPSSETIEEAMDRNCQCLITHHPLIFRPVNSVRQDKFPENLIIRCLRSGIHLIAAHTNLDVAREGTNDRLAELLALAGVKPLEVDGSWHGEERYSGMGCIGFLAQPLFLQDLIDRVRSALGNIRLRFVGEPLKKVRRIAVCTGSGGSLLEQVISAGCDAYVTGDIKYHDAKRAMEGAVALIDVGHFASERLILQPLAAALRSEAAKKQLPVEILAAAEEYDPFRFA